MRYVACATCADLNKINCDEFLKAFLRVDDCHTRELPIFIIQSLLDNLLVGYLKPLLCAESPCAIREKLNKQIQLFNQLFDQILSLEKAKGLCKEPAASPMLDHFARLASSQRVALDSLSLPKL